MTEIEACLKSYFPDRTESRDAWRSGTRKVWEKKVLSSFYVFAAHYYEDQAI